MALAFTSLGGNTETKCVALKDPQVEVSGILKGTYFTFFVLHKLKYSLKILLGGGNSLDP